jgi:hypothetical protein
VKKREEEKIIEYFERNGAFIALHLVGTTVLSYLMYKYIAEVSPWAFIIGLPAAIVVFQTIWILLNPYALIYVDKIEIKGTMFGNKVWYLIDIKKVGEVKGKGFSITYNDDEVEYVNPMGIRASQLNKFRDSFNHYVCKSLVERDD